MASVQVWVKDDNPDEPCMQCERTMAFLQRNKIPFEQKSLSDATPEQMNVFRKIGSTAPVVLTKDHGNWAGMNPGKLKELKKAHSSDSPSPPSAAPSIEQMTPSTGPAGPAI